MLNKDEKDREFFESVKKLEAKEDLLLKVKNPNSDDEYADYIKSLDSIKLITPLDESEIKKIKPNYYKLDGCKEVWDIEEKILEHSEIFQNHPMIFKLWSSAFEYFFRCGVKGDIIKDIKKAITYLEKMLELLEKDNG